MDHEKRKKQRLNHDTIGAPQRQPLHLNTITAHPLSTTAATPTLDSDDDFVDADIPRDTEAAIMILKKEFPASIQGVCSTMLLLLSLTTSSSLPTHPFQTFQSDAGASICNQKSDIHHT